MTHGIRTVTRPPRVLAFAGVVLSSAAALAGCGAVLGLDLDGLRPLEPEIDANLDVAADGTNGADSADADSAPQLPQCGRVGQPCCGNACTGELVCSAGACACAGGVCPPEVVGKIPGTFGSAAHLAVDADNVFWFDENSGGAVFVCPKTGCPGPPQMLVEGLSIGNLVSDGASVYWADISSGKIQKCGARGCNKQPTTLVVGQTMARGVWSDGAALYWTSSADGGSVLSCPRSACASATVLAKGLGELFEMGAESNNVIWATSSALQRCAGSGCSQSPSLVSPAPGRFLSVAGGNVYFVSTASETIVRCSVGGCPGGPMTVGTSTAPRAVVSDGLKVYWEDHLDNKILACSATGCGGAGTRVIAKNQTFGRASQLALDGAYIYWTADDAVFRVRR